MSYNTLNHTEQGGAVTHIGGTLEIAAGASVTGITTATIVDNVTSTDTDKALSANQGKVLKGLVDAKIATAAIVNDVTTGGVAVPLSAEQGKTLKGLIPVAATTAAAGIVLKAVNVPVAAGEAPTKAEFDALINALVTAGIITAAE